MRCTDLKNSEHDVVATVTQAGSFIHACAVVLLSQAGSFICALCMCRIFHFFHQVIVPVLDCFASGKNEGTCTEYLGFNLQYRCILNGTENEKNLVG